MRKRNTICWLLAGAALMNAEIIDRIAVSVGNQVITVSDLDREIRVTAFLNGAQPGFTAEAKRRAADMMVRQRLVRREIELSKYPQPDPSDVEPVLKHFKEENYPDAAAYNQALAKAEVTDQEVRAQILWQLTFLRFIDVRFRPGVQVSDEDVQAYFTKSIEPAAKAASAGQAVLIDDYRERIIEILTEQQVDKDLDTWIREAIKRTVVEYRPEVFRP